MTSTSVSRKIVVMGGCGHIGLPLSIRLSISGWQTVAVDVNATVVDQVNQGHFPFRENSGDELLAKALEKGLKASTDESEYRDAWAVIIVTGMDLDIYGNPRIEFVREHLLFAADRCPRDALLLLRSTLYPGSMALLAQALDLHLNTSDSIQRLAYCPERTSELFALEELETLPQLVSACSEAAFERAYTVFRTVSPIIIRVSPLEAELAKLITNAWRYMEFGLSNEMYGLAHRAGVNFSRLLEAIRFRYPRAAGFRLPGFTAGPCLLKDTRMLISFGGSSLPHAISSVTVNESMVDLVLEKLCAILHADSSDSLATSSSLRTALPHSLVGFTIGLLGMAFKPNSDDFRQSLSFKLRKVAERRGAAVLIHDPSLATSTDLNTLIDQSQGLILCVPHKEYLDVDFKGKPLIDVWCGLESNKPKLDLLPGTQSVISLLGNDSSVIKTNRSNIGQDGKRLPTILVTGSAGFIGGYVVQELLTNGYHVIGVDNYSKYGPVEKDYDNHPHYEFYQEDAKNVDFMKQIAIKCDYILACAAMIGGISYFHTMAYDLLSENDRIIAATFDAAIHAFQQGHLKKIVVLSSSMVFESATIFPTPEGEQERCPPPQSTYGFQKLACEFYAKGAWEQYGLPYTIIRPFNCVGIGERRAKCDHEVMSGNVKLAMSHVVPDLVQKILKGQDPLHILGSGSQIRHYTYGGDLARGIRLCIENDKALNNDFNLSTETSTSVLELAELIWNKIYQGAKPFRYTSDEPFKYDVQKRVPNCSKAKELLNFEATTTLEEILEELLPWIRQQLEFGNL